MADKRAVVFCPSPLGIFEQSLALQEAGRLGAMALGFYSHLDRQPWRGLPEGRLRSYLTKRYRPEIDGSLVRMHPQRSAIVELGRRLTKDRKRQDELVFWSNRGFDSWISKNIPKFGNLVVGYESSSLETFRCAQRLGLPRVLYQPIPCADIAVELLADEARMQPALAGSLRYNYFPPSELARRQEERELADVILCASSFTKASLVQVGVRPEKVVVIPYGVDQEAFKPTADKFDVFSVIWAGSFTQTKGIGYLLEALARAPVPGAELVLAGYAAGRDAVTHYEDRVRVRRVGHLDHAALARSMARCHVHVFPTLLDGFGRNIIEAMASGLPVIATPNCAAADLIEDGVTGFLVSIRDVDTICERLVWIHQHPQQAIEMGLLARTRVQHLTRAAYRRSFAAEIDRWWK